MFPQNPKIFPPIFKKTHTTHTYKCTGVLSSHNFSVYSPTSYLLGIPLLQRLPNRRELDITRPLINRTNLAIPEVLFRQSLPHKSHTTHPLHSLPTHLSGHLARVQLGHGGVHDEVLACFLFAGGVVDEGARGLDFGPGLRELVLHGLKFADELAELFAVVPGVAVSSISTSYIEERVLGVYEPRGVLPCAERETGHLCGDADAAFVQEANGVFVALEFFAEKILLGDFNIVKIDDAGTARPDTQFLLLLRNRESLRALLDNERRDALVLLARVKVGKHDEEIGFDAVCYPHFAAADLVAGVCACGFCGEREGVGAGDGFGKAEGADGVGGELGEIFLLHCLGAPFEDRGVDEGVVHVAEDADAGVDARELFNGDDGGCEVHARPAVFFWDLNAHESLFEELFYHSWVHGLGLVHVSRLW
jgi:hypothetical protein